MLEPLMHSVLSHQKIILASGSPRRKEILQQLGLKFNVAVSEFDENLDPSTYRNHGEYAIDTASHKVKEVSERLALEKLENDLIIGADTIVSLNGKILEKPKDAVEAVSMLKELSGKQHTVFTGVCLKKGNEYVAFAEKTLVTVAQLPVAVIESYVASGEPMDKAGGYGIQGKGGSLIEKIDGDYFNVMGLPLHHLCREILKLYKFNGPVA